MSSTEKLFLLVIFTLTAAKHPKPLATMACGQRTSDLDGQIKPTPASPRVKRRARGGD